ncbi:MAG: hypothetical protein QM571_02440 [Micrococcaceae bacterium]
MYSVKRSELSERDAIRDGFNDLTELNAALDTHYSGLKYSDTLDIVKFSLVN